MSVARRLTVVALAVVAVGATAPRASADLVMEFGNYSTLLDNGPAPSQNGTYFTATFARTSATTVQATFNVSNVTPGLYVDTLFLNFNATGASFSHSSGATASSGSPSYSSGGYTFNAQSGAYDTKFDYPNSGSGSVRLENGNNSVYNITLTGVSLSSDLSNLFTLNAKGYSAAAKLNGYGNSSLLAGRVRGGGVFAVPEPGTLTLAALTGTFGLGLSRVRRFRNAVFATA